MYVCVNEAPVGPASTRLSRTPASTRQGSASWAEAKTAPARAAAVRIRTFFLIICGSSACALPAGKTREGGGSFPGALTPGPSPTRTPFPRERGARHVLIADFL